MPPPSVPTSTPEIASCHVRRVDGVDIPERVRVGGAEGSVVGEDLDVVEAVPAGAVERAEDRGDVRVAVAGKHAVGPAPRRLATVADVDAGDERRVALDLVEEVGRVPEMPDVELDASAASRSPR